MSDELQKLRAHFERDHYAPLIEFFERKGIENSSVKRAWTLFVGAFSFSGKVLEAQSLLKITERESSSKIEELIEARFYVAVGLVRQSNYNEARRLFVRSLQDLGHTTDQRARFFVFQGVAFYRYFCARFLRSNLWAERAYTEAFRCDFRWGKMLSLELLGYSRCQAGLVTRGLEDLATARKLSAQLGNEGSASLHAVLIFEAALGRKPETIVEELQEAIDNTSSENVYSRSALRLELSRQYLLRGQGTDSKRLLDEASAEIYRNANRRQTAILHLRYAYVSFLEGHTQQALLLLKSAQSSLQEKIDTLYIEQLQGLERLITKSLRLDSTETPVVSEGLVGNRILKRQLGGVRSQHLEKYLNRGEDPLGDLLDLAGVDVEKALVEISKHSYWGLLPQLLKIPAGSDAIVFDLYQKSICLVSSTNVEFRKLAGKGIWQKLAILLSEGFSSKEQIVEKVWGLKYHSLRHDPLLYAAIAKLRKALGKCGHWIEWNEQGYRLRPGVKVYSRGDFFSDSQAQEKMDDVAARSEASSAELKQDFSLLNHRQIQVLSFLKKKKFLGVKDYAKLFSVSQVTACRDLSSLVELDKIKKSGRARATRYYLEG